MTSFNPVRNTTMMTFPRFALVAALLLWLSGCSCAAVKDQVSASAQASDTYAALVEATLDGSISPADGTPVSAADWAATPVSVRELTQNVVRALYLQRYGWHAANFALDQGPDPDTAGADAWVPPAFPGEE